MIIKTKITDKSLIREDCELSSVVTVEDFHLKLCGLFIVSGYEFILGSHHHHQMAARNLGLIPQPVRVEFPTMLSLQVRSQ